MTNGTEGSRANPASWTRNGAPRSSRPRTRRGTDTAPFRPACHDSAQVHRVATVAVLVLGLGGEVGQHFFETYARRSPAEDARAEGHAHDESPLAHVDLAPGVHRTEGYWRRSGPTFTLLTQHGRKWRLASHKGQVIVLAFYDAICNDICPVLGAEIQLASHELGAEGSTVHFVIVNTDPNATKISSSSPALTVPGLGNDPSVTLLSGASTRSITSGPPTGCASPSG